MSFDPTSDLINALQALSIQNPKLVRGNVRSVPGDPNSKITTWKMSEFKYSEYPSPFPTLARGLFTQETTPETQVGPKEHRIVVRGYDKFFNIGEVRWNSWPSIEKYTEAPYVLTLKSNGCIIFISALSPTKLVITSKHSLGAIGDGEEVSHAQMGERWLKKHLETKGKMEVELAAVLWEQNLTAVSELCDDSFEEHVLGYPAELTGLHLHGLNKNTGEFQTTPMDEVEKFALEWGFIPTPILTMDSATAVREFTDEIAKTGKWNGIAIEGFVVRTKVKASSASSSSPSLPIQNDPRDATMPPPYPRGSDYFFKVKFEEPYLMYRDWREITRSILSKLGTNRPMTVPKSKLRRPESRVYRKWVEKEMERDIGQFAQFNKGKGIIAVREKFLAWLETEEGKQALENEKGDRKEVVSREPGEQPRKTVIVPVAIPGCGKTTIGLVLCRLFGFGHTQSDDIKAKKTAATFERNICNLLKEHDVVFADRNNQLQSHRSGIRSAVNHSQGRRVRLVALDWKFNFPTSTVHRICSDRVSDRGDNHQSLRADPTKVHEEIIWRFINDAEPLEEGEVDEVIEMDLEEDFETSVDRAVSEVARVLGLKRPEDELIREACELAQGYQVEVKKPMQDAKKFKPPRYFGFLPEVNLHTVIDEALAQENAPEKLKTFWERLKENKRVTSRPHITIVHSKSLPHEQDLWDRCDATRRLLEPPVFNFRLDHIVYDDRVMAIHIADVTAPGSAEGTEFMAQFPDEVRRRLHITVGTRDAKVPAVEGRGVVERWKLGRGDVEVLQFENRDVTGRLTGLFS